MPLRNVLRHDPLVGHTDDFIEDVLQRMTERGITVTPVIDEESGKFLGTVTSHDVLEHMLSAARGEHLV